MENSDILHGKILQKFVCILQNSCRNCLQHGELFEKSFIVLGFNLMFSGPEHRFLALNLDWNPKSFSEGKCRQRKTQINFWKKT